MATGSDSKLSCSSMSFKLTNEIKILKSGLSERYYISVYPRKGCLSKHCFEITKLQCKHDARTFEDALPVGLTVTHKSRFASEICSKYSFIFAIHTFQIVKVVANIVLIRLSRKK